MRLELTSRSSYAVRAVIAVARAQASGRAIVPAPEVASAMSIPPRFLPQVMSDLVRAGILTARIGRGGGYQLARPADQIAVLDIVEASEGDRRGVRCILRGTACGVGQVCDVHELFVGAQSALRERLAGATVADVLGSS
jgi:Rrf2 family protein